MISAAPVALFVGGAGWLAVEAPPDGISGYLTYGPLGLMVVGFLLGLIVPGPTHKRIVDENDRLRALIDEKVWPTINDATSAIRDSTETVKEVVRLLPPPEEPPRRRRAGS